MRYVLYDKTDKRILMISDKPIQIANPNHAVATTTIEHSYIYVDSDGSVKEMTEDQIKKIQLQTLRNSKEQTVLKLNKKIDKILSAWKRIYQNSTLLVSISSHLRLEDNDFYPIIKAYVTKELSKDEILQNINRDAINLFNSLLYRYISKILVDFEYSIKLQLSQAENVEDIRSVYKSIDDLEQYQLLPIAEF